MMGAVRWFKNGEGGIDVEKEFEGTETRSPLAWAMCVARMVIAELGGEVPADDTIASNPQLGYFEFGEELIVYRLTGEPPRPEVLLAGKASSSRQKGQLISEAERRSRM